MISSQLGTEARPRVFLTGRRAGSGAASARRRRPRSSSATASAASVGQLALVDAGLVVEEGLDRLVGDAEDVVTER